MLANKLMSKDEEGQASLINISLVTRILLILSNFVLSTARELHVASEAAADAAVASFAIISVSPGTLVGMIDRGRVSVLSASGFHAVKTLRQSVSSKSSIDQRAVAEQRRHVEEALALLVSLREAFRHRSQCSVCRLSRLPRISPGGTRRGTRGERRASRARNRRATHDAATI